MKRRILTDLEAWKGKDQRKPLVLKGARQVGKTYILEEFGKQSYQSCGGAYHYIDLKEEKKLHSIFNETNDPHEIIRVIQLHLDRKIDTIKDLLIIDEIQDCAGAMGSLKYFEKNMNSLAVIAAGSHLGLVANEESFPIGKVNFLYMFPMTFDEFLMAFDSTFHQEFQNFDINSLPSQPELLHEKFLEVLRYYYFTGGLPEVVSAFVQNYKNNEFETIDRVRQIQNELIEGYQADFSKYSGTVNANHIHHVFQSIPMQLSKAHDSEVRRYKFSGVIPKQKGFSRIAGPLQWLVQSRLCLKSFIASRAEEPLMGYSQENKFKIYLFDTGLLHSMLKTQPADILNDELGSYKGYIAENFVAQELYAKTNSSLFSWQEGNAEVEFLISSRDGLIPVEVKASSRSRRAKSLDSYIQRYKPKKAYKLCGQNVGYDKNRQMTILPIYFVSKIMI